MEKITKKKTKLSLETNNDSPVINEGEDSLMNQTDYEQLERMRVIGWDGAMDCANSLWSSIHASLLNGNLVFAYRISKSDTGFVQVVVVQNPNYPNDFGVGEITNGWTALIPHIGLEQLRDLVLDDFKKYKVETKIQNIFKAIIERYKQ